MSDCAFCPKPAKISGEHIWSEWMRELFPSKRFVFTQRDESGTALRQWRRPAIDLTANVVCKQCNEGWMSDIESQHASPAMRDLIVGDKGITVSQSRAKSMAIFAFKTAVIVDHMRRGGLPFFRRAARYEFRKSRLVPDNVQMWFAGFLPMGAGRVESFYPQASSESATILKMYVCTYMVGHLIFQVVAARFRAGMPSFSPQPGFEYLAIPFWPSIPARIRWPPQDVIRNSPQFKRFAERWGDISLL